MLVAQLRALGVQPGGTVLVHTALSRVGCDPRSLIEALLTAIGPQGTLVMPSMADDDDVPFDRTSMPCRAVGVVADTFWRMSGVLRSDNPHAFAAQGPLAARITAPHPVDVHDCNTTVHVAEALAGVRYRQPKHATILEAGKPRRYEYGETDHCCERFAFLDAWLGEKQTLGKIGGAQARLARSRDIVEAALARLREEETVFLHAAGTCAECDSARAGIT